MDWIFVGDAHFARGDKGRRKHFSRFIQKNRSTLGTLVIMGDFFDFWFGFRDCSSLKKEYGDVLELLEELRADGVRVIYLEGNHDFSLGSYMREELGIEVYDRAAEMELDGKRMFLAHGDRISPTLDHWIVSGILRNWFAYHVTALLGSRIVMAIAHRWSASSRGRNMERSPVVIKQLRSFARRKLKQGFDAVILAHTHLPEAITVKEQGREAYYFNVGDWIKDFSYLRYNEKKGFSLEYYKTRKKARR
ncbi:MAG: metallophosphoesterase [Deltaproteobacteria bacterium]|nr:metallophosphoesterase [Deltaproteobacteria bacterium]